MDDGRDDIVLAPIHRELVRHALQGELGHHVGQRVRPRGLGRNAAGDAAADAVAGAGDDRDLALELSGHPVLP